VATLFFSKKHPVQPVGYTPKNLYRTKSRNRNTALLPPLCHAQAMILVQDPYYNEPAHEAARGTDTGRSSAASYDAELTLNVSARFIENLSARFIINGYTTQS